MRRALLLPLLLLSASAAAATLRDDVKQPGKIKDAFPKSARLRVVNIWATWCVPCVVEMPELRKTAAALGSEAAFVGVSVDDTIPDAKPASVAAFLDKQKIAYTNIYYRGSVDDLTSYYRFEGEIPITLAFDRSGKEVWRHAGPIRSAEAIAELRKILRRMR